MRFSSPYGASAGYGPGAGQYDSPYYRPTQQPVVSASSVIARQDRIHVWSLPYLFVIIIGIGSLFTFYEILDINVSFLQTCQNIVPGCTPQNAAQFLGLPVLFNLAGYVVGALILSPLADRFGRRNLLVYTLVLTGIGALLNGFVMNYPEFIAARTITGIGVGADIVLVNTYINEVAPRGGRARYTSLILILSAIGSVLGIWAGLVLTTPPAPFPYGLPFALDVQPFGWRILYFVGAALMLVGIVLRVQLPESPRWLVARGRLHDADTVVREMEDRAAHRAPLPSAMDEIPVTSGKAGTPFGLLLKNPFYLKRTVLLLALWLTGYVTLYSYLAGLTTILATLGYSPSEGGLIVAVGVAGFVLAAIVSYFFSERIERKHWLPVAVVLTLVGGLLLATAGPNTRSGQALLVEFLGSLFIFAGFIWLAPTYSWSTENFPTRARTTGFGIVDGVGHIGGGIGILLIAPYLHVLGAWESFLLIDAFLVVAAIIAQFGPSTRGKRLDTVSP
jgi:MFS family permease